jgi:integrase
MRITMAKRRLNREGSLTLRKDGLWVGRVSHQGKRVSIYGKTKEEARGKLRELIRKQEDNRPVSPSKMLLKDYLAQWLERIQYEVRPKTLGDYKSLVRLYITPYMGKIQLGKLDPIQIEKAWSDLLKSGKSTSVVQHVHVRLSKALTDAVDRLLIPWNPCQSATPPRVVKKEIYPPDANAMSRILDVARTTDYYEPLHAAFHSGLRRGELLAINWRDVDLNMATVSVARSLYRAKGGLSIYQDTKTAKGRRLVSLTPASALVLRSLRERQEADGLLLGYEVNDDSPVFRYRDGSPILPSGLTHAFTKIMRRAGLEGYRLHDVRHAHATLMLKQGVHPKIVQERLGHSRIGTTLDTYSHVTPGLQEAAALRFEEGLTGTTKPEQVTKLA